MNESRVKLQPLGGFQASRPICFEVRSGVLKIGFYSLRLISSIQFIFFASVSVTIWLFPVFHLFILERRFSWWNFWTWPHHFWSCVLFFNVQYGNSFNWNVPLTIRSTTVTFSDHSKLVDASGSFSSLAIIVE